MTQGIDDLQALEKQMLIEEVEMCGVTILGEQIVSLETPSPEFQAWKLEYRGYDDTIYTLIAAWQPVTIKGQKLIPVPVEDEIIEEEE